MPYYQPRCLVFPSCCLGMSLAWTPTCYQSQLDTGNPLICPLGLLVPEHSLAACKTWRASQEALKSACLGHGHLRQSLKPRGIISKSNRYFGSPMKYLGNWSCTVYVWVGMVGRRLGWFGFQFSEGLYCHSKGKWMYFPPGLVLRVLRAISVSCSDKRSSDPSRVPWTCVVGLKFSMHAGKPAWTVHLLSEGWRGETLPSCSFDDGHKGAKVNPSVPYKRLLQWMRTEGTRREGTCVQEQCVSWPGSAPPGWCHHRWGVRHTGGRQLSRLASCCS